MKHHRQFSLPALLLRLGGMLNLLMFLFHLALSLALFRQYGRDPVYPLLQMFNVSATILMGFLAYTSLRDPAVLRTRGLGLGVVGLNIATYLARGLGEVLLSPQPRPLIIGVCLLAAGLYGAALLVPRPADATAY